MYSPTSHTPFHSLLYIVAAVAGLLFIYFSHHLYENVTIAEASIHSIVFYIYNPPLLIRTQGTIFLPWISHRHNLSESLISQGTYPLDLKSVVLIKQVSEKFNF